jgi:hypothetical protein
MNHRSAFGCIAQSAALTLGFVITGTAFPQASREAQGQKKPVAEKIPVWLFGTVRLELFTEGEKRIKSRNYPVLLYVKGTQQHWVGNYWFFWGYLWYQEADVIMEVDGQMSCTWGQEPDKAGNEVSVSAGGRFVEELLYARYGTREQGKIPEGLIPYPAHSRMVYGGDFSYGFGWNFGARPLQLKERRTALLKIRPILCHEN